VIGHRYRIDRILGIGGMAAVMDAQHGLSGQHLAIKMVPAACTRNVERLHHEAKILAQIRHPAIVALYDLDWSAPFQAWYLVEPFLEGRDLQEELSEQGPLDANEVCRWIEPAMEGLSVLHAQGIVHRDLKPENLVLTCDARGHPFVTVIDFGIARQLGEPDPEDTEPFVLGSPCSMSPEQIQATHQIGPQSDVWSLGVTLYRLVTGKKPFRAPSHQALLERIMTTDPEPADVVNPALSSHFGWILARAMKRSLTQRYASVQQMLQDLRACEPYQARTSCSRETDRAKKPAVRIPPTPTLSRVPTQALP